MGGIDWCNGWWWAVVAILDMVPGGSGRKYQGSTYTYWWAVIYITVNVIIYLLFTWPAALCIKWLQPKCKLGAGRRWWSCLMRKWDRYWCIVCGKWVGGRSNLKIGTQHWIPMTPWPRDSKPCTLTNDPRAPYPHPMASKMAPSWSLAHQWVWTGLVFMKITLHWWPLNQLHQSRIQSPKWSSWILVRSRWE